MRLPLIAALTAATVLALSTAPVAARCSDGAAADDPGFQAVTINTPGQSGHVSALDLAAATGGVAREGNPHLSDQLDEYAALRYRPGGFASEAGRLPDATIEGARIYRDAYGVPAVFAEDLRSAWTGVGYALSQDRMWQQHLLRMAAKGRLAELVGDDGIEMDIATRRDYYTAAEYDAFLGQLSDDERAVLEGYADGVNRYLVEMHADPEKMPAEIAALALPVEPWTARDSLILGALVARNVASGGGQELDNAQLLTRLAEAHGREEALAVFQDLVWLDDPGAPTSVPAEEGEFTSYPHGEPAEDALERSAGLVLGELPAQAEAVAQDMAAERALEQRLTRELGLPRGGSNGWVVSPERSADGSTLLFNGPQVGYTVPGLLTEFEIHITTGPHAVSAKGVTVAGTPIVGIGYTPHHAWGVTSGLSDTIDLYVEKLTGPRAYAFQGESRDMDCRTETFVVKSTVALADGAAPRVEQHELCRTVHGPVIAIDEAAGVAYSQRYAIWDAEIDTLKGLLRFPYARSLEEFREAVHLTSWNENTFYADAEGHIAYWHPGRYPLRPRGFDERLPYPGTGEAEWEGLIDPEDMPHAIDPEQGWLANWNSKPAQGWTSGDPHYGDRPYGEANRLTSLTDVLGSDEPIGALPAPGDDGLVAGRQGIFAPDVNGGLYDQTVETFRPFLAEAADHPAATSRLREAIALIAAWDGSHQDADGDGLVDAAGETIFNEWVEKAAKEVFAPYLLTGGFSRGGHRFEPSPAVNLFLRALQGDEATLPQSRDYLEGRAPSVVVLETLDRALDRLAERFPGQPMAQWRRPAGTVGLEVQGLGPGGRIPYQDRGSWIEVVRWPARG